MPKAWRISGAVDDACTTVPASVIVVLLRVLTCWNDRWQVTAWLKATVRQDHFNDLWHFIPRSGGPLAICADNSFGRRQESGSITVMLNCHHNCHPWRSLAIPEETTKRANNRAHPRIMFFRHVHTPCEDLCLGNLGPLVVTKRTYIFTYIYLPAQQSRVYLRPNVHATLHTLSAYETNLH